MKKVTKNRKVNGKIYCITNKINGHKYIGMTINELKIRINTHFNLKASGAPLLVKAIKKYGKSDFSVKIIDTAKTIGELDLKEKYWIKKLNTKAPNGYNLTNGGFTNEAAIIAHRESIKCKTTGKIYKSIIEASEDTNIPRQLIGFVCCGRQDETHGIVFEYIDKKKRNRANLRRKKRKQHVLKTKTKIKNITDGEIYHGYSEAIRKTGAPRNSIRLCLLGRIDTAGGKVFEFMDLEKRKIANKTRYLRKEGKYVK